MKKEGMLSSDQIMAAYTSEEMQDMINAIPGGVAVYKVSDVFETLYFSNSMPELSGYTEEAYRKLVKKDAGVLINPEDRPMVVSNFQRAVQAHKKVDFEVRRLHRDGHFIWFHVQAKQIGEEEGLPLLQCVFHDISALKETQQERDHLVNSIPGGIVSYQVEEGRFLPLYFSDGVPALSGHTREEFKEIVKSNALDIIYEPDRVRILAAIDTALKSGTVLDVSYRMRHKDESLIWIHLNGRRMGPISESMRFYAVITSMSAENHLFQNIASETADGIYVIDKKTYELLYVNEPHGLFAERNLFEGQKCYTALYEKDAPCNFCPLKSYGADGEEHEIELEGTGRICTVRSWESDWHGIPAYVQYIQDITEETNTRQEKERLEMYFQTVVENLPGGISVIRCEPDGSLTPEFVSDGFAAMLQMSTEKVKKMYEDNIYSRIHPADAESHVNKIREYVKGGEGHCDLTVRMKRGNGGYIWVKSTLSLLQSLDGVRRIYSVYTDISKSMEEKEQFRIQYENIILQHYRTPGPDELILGHCNITQNRILEIVDHTDSDLLKTFGSTRENFFTGIASLVVNEEERREFLGMYLGAPALAAFQRKETERILKCYIQLPRETHGRYVQFKVNLVETPDTGDITGVLTVTDITEQTISDRILHQLSVTSYDYVIDLNLERDFYTVVSLNKDAKAPEPPGGNYSERIASMAQNIVVPKDRERYAEALDMKEIRKRLEKANSYTIAYSVISGKGDIRTKNMTVSAVDLRLGRVCLVCTDITDSVREEQGLLNMMAYTFELMGIIRINSGHFTMYTRQAVLENLPPRIVEHYEDQVKDFTDFYGVGEDKEEVYQQFKLKTMLRRLSEQPTGYDFVFRYQSQEGMRYKQMNVLWGDENHSTICVVRADVTDILAAERKSQQELEKALNLAKEASRAKSDFLSSMSHDIRTPMNAIMGMTKLALTHRDKPERMIDCLQKISISSKHLLSLINDILDMSKIEQSNIPLNHMPMSLSEVIEQISTIIAPQAEEKGIQFHIQRKAICHEHFYGDPLRINQVFLNLLSNAVKFTPGGGKIAFLIEEIPSVKNTDFIRYQFTVSDTGIGMTETFLSTAFTSFSRSRTVNHIEGTGLGLSITKGLVDLMDGVISAESQVNQGSTFYVELECEKAPSEIEAQKENVGIGTRSLQEKIAGLTFLVVEDIAINAEILCELLEMAGAKTVLKTDGAQAVQAFQDEEPGTYDAILMDIQMPVMNGYQATRSIRALERPDAKVIPIIAMTADAFAEDIRAAKEAGMDGHMAKPLDKTALKREISKYLKD